jgi:hypothetical protein
MFTWEEAGLLRILLLVLKWSAIVLVASMSLLAAAVLAGCPTRGRSTLSTSAIVTLHPGVRR